MLRVFRGKDFWVGTRVFEAKNFGARDFWGERLLGRGIFWARIFGASVFLGE